eukprot:5974829-Prymnesium_polylepis.1
MRPDGARAAGAGSVRPLRAVRHAGTGRSIRVGEKGEARSRAPAAWRWRASRWGGWPRAWSPPSA